MFSDRIWSQMQFTIKWSLVSLVFSGPEWLHVRSLILAMKIMISWFVLTLELSARLQNVQQCICSDWKKLETQSANLQTKSGFEGILSKHFFLFRRRLSSSKCSFIVYCKRSLLTPFCEFCNVTVPNRHAHIRIMRRIWNRPIRNAHICLCDSAGY